MADGSISELSRSGIYEIRNVLNGKRYIGSAKNLKERWREHKTRLINGWHHSRHLQSAWNRYGSDAFQFLVIEQCDVDRLIEREQAAFDLLGPEYNVCKVAGSTLGRLHSGETRAKIAAKALGRKPPPRSAEYRANLSASLKGKQKTAEHMAALQRGRSLRVFTEEQRQAVGASLCKAYEDGRRSRVKNEQHKNRISQAFSVLSEDQVRDIRASRTKGETNRSIARRYSIPESTASQIARGLRYRWVA